MKDEWDSFMKNVEKILGSKFLRSDGGSCSKLLEGQQIVYGIIEILENLTHPFDRLEFGFVNAGAAHDLFTVDRGRRR